METIAYELQSKPELGSTVQIAEGIHWLRMPLPFALNHINLWLLQDGDGKTIVDTGIGTDVSRDIWRNTLSTVMPEHMLSRVIVTHLHPDHVGCAGWLVDEYDVRLWMTREEYLLCRILVADTGRVAPNAGQSFYKAAGFPDDSLEHYRKLFGMFGRLVAPLPESYRRLCEGDIVPIGTQDWEVIIGRGHSPEHACLYAADANILIAGDQLLPTISSNVSVYPTEPDANPLADWMSSLRTLRRSVPKDVLVLPAHGKPFRGAHGRLDQLVREHEEKLEQLLVACTNPLRAVDTFSTLYRRTITNDNLIMATGEAIAHLNYLVEDGELQTSKDDDGVSWYQRKQ